MECDMLNYVSVHVHVRMHLLSVTSQLVHWSYYKGEDCDIQSVLIWQRCVWYTVITLSKCVHSYILMAIAAMISMTSMYIALNFCATQCYGATLIREHPPAVHHGTSQSIMRRSSLCIMEHHRASQSIRERHRASQKDMAYIDTAENYLSNALTIHV